MSRVKFGDVVKDVKINIDRLNNPYEYYVAGDHMDSEDLTIHRKGCFTTDDVGPAFIRVFKPGQILYGSRRTYLKKIAVADFEGVCANTTFVFETKDPHAFEQRLLPFIMLSKDFTTWSIAKSKGSTNPYVLFSDLADFEFELPPLEEQKVLVDKLWAAYRLKEAYKKLLVATDEMVKSQFIEMFGNPVTNTKGWKTAKIKDVAPEMPSKEQLSGKIWLLNLDMIESNTGRIIEKVYEDVENALSVQSFDEGNVLFSKLRPYLNKVVIPDEPGMATTELVPLRPEPSKLHKVFLSHLLRGNQFVNYANDIAGGTKMPRMPLTELRNFDCILPPMDKQLEFVFIAEQADKSKFGDFKSQFIEMFGDPMTNTKAWVEFGYIGNYTQIVLGTTPNSKNSSYWNGEIKWITPAEMTEESYYIYDTERHLTEEGLKAANLTLLPCRSVLFSTRAPIGKVGLVGSPMYCNQGFKNFVCGDQLNPVYLYYSLIFKREYLVSLGTGTTFKELSKKAVENLKIAVPPLILQNKFEEIYQQADKSKSVIQKALVYLNDIQSDELGKIA